jgi:hypothetical protein
MRGTLFLLSARDDLSLRASLQPGVTRGLTAIVHSAGVRDGSPSS